MLDHEQRYWQQTAAERGIRFEPLILKTTVAAATLLGATTQAEALSTLDQLPGLRGQPENQLYAVDSWLRTLYPAPLGKHWGKLEPDRIAEYLIGSLAADDDNLINVLLSVATKDQRTTADTMLSRASTHQTHLAAQAPDALEREGPALSLRSAIETTFEAVGIEKRQVTWQRWLEPERGP
jgi:hypothetical protein